MKTMESLDCQYNVNTIPLRVVMAEYDHYLTLPKCQREYAWETKGAMKERLIDTILRGWPMTPITVQRMPTTLIGRSSAILDGQQRLRTIRSYFLGEFPTAKRFRDEPQLVVLERNRRFSELSEMGRQSFLDYNLPIVIISGAENVDSGSIYRRLNSQLPLTWAEKLYSYSEHAPDFEKDILSSPVWKMFVRRSDRKQVFQMGVMCHMIQASGSGIKNTTLPTAANEVASHAANTALRKDVQRNLDRLAYMFDGLSFTAMGEIIPLYQAIYFLQLNHANFQQSELGCLLKWYLPLREISLARERRRRTANGPISLYELADTPAQISFWADHLQDMLLTEGVVLKDQRRTFSMVDRLRMLNSQNGKCARCGKKVDAFNADADHVKSHASGGDTEIQNGQMICRACHGKKTSSKQASS